ncbi:MAG TPA: PD-(D/E)XK nuclease family protein, partial [Labilithrix sp.]
GGELGRIHQAYEDELGRAGLADRALVFRLAAEAARDPGGQPSAVAASILARPLLLLDVPVLAALERDLIAALAARAPDVLATVPHGDERSLLHLRAALGVDPERLAPEPSPSSLGRLQAHLFSGAAAPTGELGSDVVVLSAPGESRECVEIARAVLGEAARGTPLDRIAILLRASQYGTHVHEALRRANVPAFFARGSRKPDPAGRALLALLACAAEGLSARRFAEYLSLGVVPDDDAGAPPAPLPRADRVAPPDEEALAALLGAAATEGTPEEDEAIDPKPSAAEEDQATAFGTLRAPRHWERLLVDAAVIGGLDRWKNRLDGLRVELEKARAEYEKEGDDVRAEEGVRRDLAALETLRQFALPLVADLDALPQQATWGRWVDLLSALATRAIRGHERVLSVLAELDPMADVGRVGLTEVRLVLEPRLSQLLSRPPGRRHGKVYVATIEEARGLAFDVVFVPGLAEKIFPQKVVEDPLLLDDARRSLMGPVRTRAGNGALVTNDERTIDERLALRIAVGAARRRVVLSYPRLDVEQARPRTPSYYGLEVLHVAEGRLHDFEHLAKRAATSASARIGWPAPRDKNDAVDEAEYDLAVLDEYLRKPESECVGQAHYLLHTNEHLARALRFRGRRWLKAWKASDGLVDPPAEALEAIRAHGLDRRSFSPTALQNFAACPYRFMLSAVHRLAPREEPAPMEDLDPLTRGSLVHEVSFELLVRLREEKLLPVTEKNLEAARARLDEVLAKVAAEYEEKLKPAIQRVWDDAVASIAADMREWLRRMTEEQEWTPAHFELSFGLKDPRAQDAKSSREPVKLDSGLQLRGSIDLVEKHLDGRLRATDYKTGKVRAKKDETVIGGGEILQPVMYALALEKLFAGTDVEGGRLYYCTAAGGFEKVPVMLGPDAREAASTVARTIGDALQRGFLPAAPNKDAKGGSACTWCDFRTVCGPYEEVRTKKKPQKPLQALIELRRIK